MLGVGRWMLGLSSIGLGGVLIWKALAQPTDAAPAYAVGALLVISGLGLLIRRLAATASLGPGLGWLLLGLPPALAEPAQPLSWYGVVEGLSFGCGGWMIAAAEGGRLGSLAAHPASRRAAQAIFGLTLIFYGVSHFLVLDYTASLIPPLFPERRALAAFTGAAHIAAGAALVLNLVPRLAITLEAAMLTAFGVIVQIPTLVAKPAERQQWVEVFASFALAGAAWALAAQIQPSPFKIFNKKQLVRHSRAEGA